MLERVRKSIWIEVLIFSTILKKISRGKKGTKRRSRTWWFERANIINLRGDKGDSRVYIWRKFVRKLEGSFYMHRRINHRHDWNYLDFSTYDLSVIRNRGNDSMLIPLKQKKKKQKKKQRRLYVTRNRFTVRLSVSRYFDESKRIQR